MIVRANGRRSDELRCLRITRGYTKHAEGSVLIETGDTKVVCTASLVDGVPPFLKGKSQGWLTAEYGMLPRSTDTRMRREAASGKQSGRTQEIQRLIGRSLRAIIDLGKLGERTIQVDCDVIQADGGTRCASVTGACVAVYDAIAWLQARQPVVGEPMRDFVAAVSVGIVNDEPMLDLDYAEDSNCGTDMNVVMTGEGGFVEVQGTAEGRPFSRGQMDALLELAQGGIAQLIAAQKERAGAMNELVLASGNPGKLREFRRLLQHLGIAVIAQAQLGIAEAEEPHPSFLENALTKARYASARANLPALADDSGLCVDALSGRPGVQSARYAGLPKSDERNNAKLLEELAPHANRRAHYTCVLALVRHGEDPEPLIAQGVWEGEVLRAPRGTGGFGYDPLFLDLESGLTGAELSLERKNELSHRGKAMRELIARLAPLLRHTRA